MAEKIKAICKYCGKEFEQYRSNYRNTEPQYCSSKCYHTASRKPKEYRTCAWFGKPFAIDSRHKGKRFCGIECAGLWKRSRPRKVTTGKSGYRYIWLSDGSGKREHIFLMEQSIGRKLAPNECVHHIDGNRANNSLDNLQLLTRGEHSRLHREKDLASGKKLFGR